MKRSANRPPGGGRGAVLIGVLFLIVVVTVMALGIGSLAVGHRSRADTDARYAAALDVAEAGINQELVRVTGNVNDADLPPGGSGSAGRGTFLVQATMLDGTTPWDRSTAPFLVTSRGTVEGVSRTVRVKVGLFDQPADYTLFGVKAGVVDTLKGSAITIDGNLGTNGKLSFSGQPTIEGSIDFHGPDSGWASNPGGSYVVNTYPDPVVWPTVESIAAQQFPSGGLAYLATHNDNALSGIVNNTISANNGTITLKGKSGGANYYLTSVNMGGNAQIVMDNSAGPITIWCGPSGGTGTFKFQGGSAVIQSSVDATKPVRIYSAASSDIVMQGNSHIDCGIYNVNAAAKGSIQFGGTPDVYGPVITNYFTLNGTVNLHYVPKMFKPTSCGYYGIMPGTWTEVNGR